MWDFITSFEISEKAFKGAVLITGHDPQGDRHQLRHHVHGGRQTHAFRSALQRHPEKGRGPPGAGQLGLVLAAKFLDV